LRVLEDGKTVEEEDSLLWEVRVLATIMSR
jgi:hypothetical protein